MDPVNHHEVFPAKPLFHALSVTLWATMAACGLTGVQTMAADAAASGLPPMLNLPAGGTAPTQIDFLNLPVLKGQHALVTQGEAPRGKTTIEIISTPLDEIDRLQKGELSLR